MTKFFSTILMTLLYVAANSSAYSDELKPFTTDGCSAFPDGTFTQTAMWIQCCMRHDYAYWKGGTITERQQADANLEQCVADQGQKDISVIMFMGVRVGGSPYYPTWYRWGYGWPYLRGYKSLTDEENKQVKKQLEVVHHLIGEFIQDLK